MVAIHDLRVVRYDYPHLEVEIECGGGTYVRALGRDLAAELGTSAVMSALVRTAIGRFRVDDAATLAELTIDTIAKYLQPPRTAVIDLPTLMLNESQLIDLRHGRPITVSTSGIERSPSRASAERAALTPDGRLAAILREKLAGELWPHRNFL
jgi:tRNA pseudouridine55 synthase